MKSLLIFTLIAQSLFGSFGASSVWQIQSTATAANANGGGFDRGATFQVTDATATGGTGSTPVLSSATYTFVAGDAGAWVYVVSGTTGGWTATTYYQIASVAAGAATLSAGIGQGITVGATAGYPTPRFSVTTVAGIASSATPSGGTIGIDYSQSDAAPFSGTDLAAVTTTTLTSASAPFGVNHVGNSIHATTAATTPGWYEIISVSGVTATIDRTIGGTGTGITFKVGGAISLGSATANQTDTLFFSSTHMAAGNRIFAKSGTYTLGQSVATAAGTAALAIITEGYNSTRGDSPTGATRPLFAAGAGAFGMGNFTQIASISFTGSALADVVSMGLNAYVLNCKIVNNSTTAARPALLISSNAVKVQASELTSYRGPALQVGSQTAVLLGNYIHDSNIGINITGAAQLMAIHNIIAGNVTQAVVSNTAITSGYGFYNNTFYGAENKQGVALALTTGTVVFPFINNIVYGFTSGVTLTDAQNSNIDNYNDYFNNTTDTSAQWAKGSGDLALNPTFAGVGQYTGTTATSSTNVLTDSGAAFTSVVDNQDFANVSAITGTGGGTGKYLITAHTATTLTLSSNLTSSGAGTAITYEVTYGHNFSPGNTSVKAGAFPGVFPGALTTGYLSMGSTQPQATSSTGFGYVQ